MSATYRIYFPQTIYSMYVTLCTAVPNVSHLQNIFPTNNIHMYVTLYTAVPNFSHLQIIFPTNNIQYEYHTIYRSTKCQPLIDNISHKQYTVCMSHYIPQ